MKTMTSIITALDKLPSEDHFCDALLCVLSAQKKAIEPKSVYEQIADLLNLSDEQRARLAKDKKSLLYVKRIQFAKKQLKDKKALEDLTGKWQLNDHGRQLAKQLPPKLKMLSTDFDTSRIFSEGKELFELHKKYERNRALVLAKKASWLEKNETLFCEVCGFDFFKHYGEEGFGYIECHHIIPVSQIQSSGKKGTDLNGLVLLCANCHRMAHYRSELLSIEQMKKLWNRNNS